MKIGGNFFKFNLGWLNDIIRDLVNYEGQRSSQIFADKLKHLISDNFKEMYKSKDSVVEILALSNEIYGIFEKNSKTKMFNFIIIDCNHKLETELYGLNLKLQEPLRDKVEKDSENSKKLDQVFEIIEDLKETEKDNLLFKPKTRFDQALSELNKIKDHQKFSQETINEILKDVLHGTEKILNKIGSSYHSASVSFNNIEEIKNKVEKRAKMIQQRDEKIRNRIRDLTSKLELNSMSTNQYIIKELDKKLTNIEETVTKCTKIKLQDLKLTDLTEEVSEHDIERFYKRLKGFQIENMNKKLSDL